MIERQLLVDQVQAENTDIERKLLESALQKLDYCLTDLFQIRKEKIRVTALQNSQINEDDLQPGEQEYLAELRRAEYLYQQNINLGSSPDSAVLTPQLGPAPFSEPTLIPIAKPETHNDIGHESQAETSGLEEIEINSSEIGRKIIARAQGDGSYMTIRFLGDEDAIMGVDLREYGPFAAGDVVYLPVVHARIFITNGKAQPILPSN